MSDGSDHPAFLQNLIGRSHPHCVALAAPEFRERGFKGVSGPMLSWLKATRRAAPLTGAGTWGSATAFWLTFC